MADGVPDSSDGKLLVLCFQWVDADLYVHEDFASVHPIKSIKSDTIVVAVKDGFTHLSSPLSIFHGQCYDEASNMTGHEKEVTSQILEASSLAFLTHFYVHALNLAVADMIGTEGLLKDTIDTTIKLVKLIKSPLNTTHSSPNWNKNFSWINLNLECYALPGGQ